MTSPAKARRDRAARSPGSLPPSSRSRRPGGTQTLSDMSVIAVGQATPLKTVPTCESAVRRSASRLKVSPIAFTAACGGEEQPGQAAAGEDRGAADDEGEEEDVADRVDEATPTPNASRPAPASDIRTVWKANAAQTAAAPRPAMAPSSQVAGRSRLISLRSISTIAA
jgi:hypothetical protein